ncbi:MAG: hypothetical protein P4L16_04405 [Chlamydiales bacterium]|nr:hypothetical protein [Chlamydiales bacterium]
MKTTSIKHASILTLLRQKEDLLVDEMPKLASLTEGQPSTSTRMDRAASALLSCSDGIKRHTVGEQLFHAANALKQEERSPFEPSSRLTQHAISIDLGGRKRDLQAKSQAAPTLLQRLKNRTEVLSRDFEALEKADRAEGNTEEMNARQLSRRVVGAVRIAGTALGMVGDVAHAGVAAIMDNLREHHPGTHALACKVKEAAKEVLEAVVPEELKEDARAFVKEDLPKFNRQVAKALDEKVGVPEEVALRAIQDVEKMATTKAVGATSQVVRKAAKSVKALCSSRVNPVVSEGYKFGGSYIETYYDTRTNSFHVLDQRLLANKNRSAPAHNKNKEVYCRESCSHDVLIESQSVRTKKDPSPIQSAYITLSETGDIRDVHVHHSTFAEGACPSQMLDILFPTEEVGRRSTEGSSLASTNTVSTHFIAMNVSQMPGNRVVVRAEHNINLDVVDNTLGKSHFPIIEKYVRDLSRSNPGMEVHLQVNTPPVNTFIGEAIEIGDSITVGKNLRPCRGKHQDLIKAISESDKFDYFGLVDNMLTFQYRTPLPLSTAHKSKRVMRDREGLGYEVLSQPLTELNQDTFPLFSAMQTVHVTLRESNQWRKISVGFGKLSLNNKDLPLLLDSLVPIQPQLLTCLEFDENLLGKEIGQSNSFWRVMQQEMLPILRESEFKKVVYDPFYSPMPVFVRRGVELPTTLSTSITEVSIILTYLKSNEMVLRVIGDRYSKDVPLGTIERFMDDVITNNSQVKIYVQVKGYSSQVMQAFQEMITSNKKIYNLGECPCYYGLRPEKNLSALTLRYDPLGAKIPLIKPYNPDASDIQYADMNMYWLEDATIIAIENSAIQDANWLLSKVDQVAESQQARPVFICVHLEILARLFESNSSFTPLGKSFECVWPCSRIPRASVYVFQYKKLQEAVYDPHALVKGFWSMSVRDRSDGSTFVFTEILEKTLPRDIESIFYKFSKSLDSLSRGATEDFFLQFNPKNKHLLDILVRRKHTELVAGSSEFQPGDTLDSSKLPVFRILPSS